MATHSGTLASWTEEPGGLQSPGSQRLGLKGLSTQALSSLFQEIGNVNNFFV